MTRDKLIGNVEGSYFDTTINEYDPNAITEPTCFNGIATGTGDNSDPDFYPYEAIDLAINSFNYTGFVDTCYKTCNLSIDHRTGDFYTKGRVTANEITCNSLTSLSSIVGNSSNVDSASVSDSITCNSLVSHVLDTTINEYDPTAITDPKCSNGIATGTGENSDPAFYPYEAIDLAINSWNYTGFVDTCYKTCNLSIDHRTGDLNTVGNVSSGTLVTNKISCDTIYTGGYSSFYNNSSSNVRLSIEIIKNVETSFDLTYDLNAFILVEFTYYATYNPITRDGMTENDQWGRTTGTIMLWPSRFFGNMGAGATYNINNQINGDITFNMIPNAYALKGRPFYVPYYNQGEQLKNISGENAYISGNENNVWIDFQSPALGNIYSKSVSGKIIDCTWLEQQGYGARITTSRL